MTAEYDAEWMLDKLEELALKLGVRVRVEALGERDGDLVFQSGTCFLRGERIILVDGRLSVEKKCHALARELKKMDISQVFVSPRVRIFLES